MAGDRLADRDPITPPRPPHPTRAAQAAQAAFVALAPEDSPCFVIDEVELEVNARLLHHVQAGSGAKILLALKGYAAFATFPMLSRYLAGTTASGLHEAMLGHEHFGGENHVYSPAFRDEEMDRIADLATHLSFNSLNQWRRHRDRPSVKKKPSGLRINPRHSEVDTPLYDPAAPGSRLGSISLADEDFDGLSGLHIHTLCESEFHALARTAAVLEQKFGHVLNRPDCRWVNLGGGHHITKPGYDVDALVTFLRDFAKRYDVQLYLEPGEAVALNAGYLVTTVLDLIRPPHTDQNIAILDMSATAHTPDVLEMPYRPALIQEDPAGQHTYRLGGLSCLAGDVIGDYTFTHPLKIGDRLAFTDMAHYSMVKTTTFNGVNLPAIALLQNRSTLKVIRRFGYEHYSSRLS